MSLDLNSLATLAMVARERSLRAAAERLGVTRSAVSQSVRKVEDALGIAVLRRTTHSVALTEVGEALLARVAPALAEIDAATRRAADREERPSGLLRLAVSSIAEHFLDGALLTAFRTAHPEISLDVLVTDDEMDIVAAGFDAGVRLGEVVANDMIALSLGPEQRQIVVAAPAYLDAAGAPATPRDLVRHRCIGWRPQMDGAPYRWEFTQDGRDLSVAVDPEVTSNDMAFMIRMALRGNGITIGMADSFAAGLATGELCEVLADYCPPLPGFFLFYPNRRNLDPKLRAFIAHVRASRGAR